MTDLPAYGVAILAVAIVGNIVFVGMYADWNLFAVGCAVVVALTSYALGVNT